MGIAAEVRAHGFAFLPAYRPNEDTLTTIANLGTISSVEGAGGDVQVLRPLNASESVKNVYSGNFGLGEFPLHTDLAHWHMPPRFLALRCVVGTSDVATLIMDGNNLVGAIGDLRLRRTLSQARRPINGSRPVMPLLDKRDAYGSCLRWDSLFLVPATEESARTFRAIGDYLANARPAHVTLLNLGDVLVLDNWRMLHGRSSVSIPATSRRVERAYLGELH